MGTRALLNYLESSMGAMPAGDDTTQFAQSAVGVVFSFLTEDQLVGVLDRAVSDDVKATLSVMWGDE